MAKQVYLPSDAEWRRIEPLLPRGRRGAHLVDDRRVIGGIVNMLRCGASWRVRPEVYGPYTTIYNRFNRWSRQGIWTDIFYALTGSTGMYYDFGCSPGGGSRPSSRQTRPASILTVTTKPPTRDAMSSRGCSAASRISAASQPAITSEPISSSPQSPWLLP